jgi:predicted HTH domain antitoxin
MIRHAGKASDGRLGVSLVDAGTIGMIDRLKEQAVMATVQIGDDLAAILDREDESLDRAARELIVFELYRRERISRGRAAELLGMPLDGFIKRASSLGIPYIDMTDDEWASEMAIVRPT